MISMFTLNMSPIRRTRQAGYDVKYHLVWVPKYRKLVWKGGLTKRLKGVFQEIAERYEFEIDTMEMKGDHVHLFLTVSLWYSPSQVVQIMKSISAVLCTFTCVVPVRREEMQRTVYTGGMLRKGSLLVYRKRSLVS